ncbi:hypothetical protein J41TS12_37160 [Paenibacillus antibioticophila]|uniref:Uncharacterized protein n=1 Tax=Paenibacillus antibioticophila TaxID=1274374 RepID=A0A919XYV7_9BACL|nr:hypothetical protein [Paenibacillus antibioticophila]GIO38855.1 hypothetical protein J41TS12_37160 [Paenibacillus antibioticophila]
MDIRQYLDFHRFAIEKQFEIILEYQKRLEASVRAAGFAEARANDRSLEYMAADLDPDEIFTQRDVWLRFEWLHRAQQESKASQNRLQEIEQHLSGINQLCGLILQSAKQGVSAVNGSTGWGMGRVVGSTELLGNVILQARNQASHYEEGSPKQRVKDCFAHLHADFGIPDDLTKNLARYVVFDVLGWHSYNAYEADMLGNF